jgi:hypothetical protein
MTMRRRRGRRHTERSAPTASSQPWSLPERVSSHCPTDTPDTLGYSFMREVSELLAAVVSEEALR